MELERYEVDIDSGDGLWKMHIVILPLMLYGETYYGRLACSHTGNWEGRWLASDSHKGYVIGETRQEVIDECLKSYHTKRKRWLNPEEKLH